MIALTLSKKVALGTMITAISLAASVLFFIARPAFAQSGLVRSVTVHNITQGQNAVSVTARPGDVIEYRLQARSTENLNRQITIENDISDLNALSELLTVSDNGERSGDILRWRDVQINSNQTITRTFRVRVKEGRNLRDISDKTMSNTFGNTVEVRVEEGDTGSGSGNFSRSASAYNETQGRNAQDIHANAGDIITIILSYRNNSNSSQHITVEADIADVLYLADVTNYGGGRLTGSVIHFGSESVSQNSTLEKRFQVRVKSVPANTVDNIISLNYGNGIDIRVRTQGGTAQTPPKGQTPAGQPYKSPETGTSENVAFLLAGLTTAYIFVLKKRKTQVIV